MQRCAADHDPIWHDEFHCPLCTAIGDAYADAERVAHYEQLVDEIDAADVLQLIAQANDAHTRAYEADTRLSILRHAIERTKDKPMGRYIETIRHAAKDTRR
jgi:hypothetical protein